MRYILMLLLIAFTSIVCADSDDIFDVIAGGSEEYEFVRYSPEEIQLKIKEDMMVACSDGLCTIFAISDSGDEFTTSFKVGYGQDIVTDDDDYIAVSGPYVGLTVSYTLSHCTQKVQVPRSVYIALNTYMYSLLSENGEPERTLMPATEAMIVFYSTIMKQANGCNN